MRFFIDGNEWTFPHMESLSREELLDALREKVASEDRVIVDMLSDGESLDDRDIMNVPDSIDVEVHTNTAWGLGLEILDEVKESLLAVFKDLQTALDGAEPWTPLTLDETKESLKWQIEVFEGIRDAYPEYDRCLPDAAALLDSVTTFDGLLAAGRYAEAHAWHENEWKKCALAAYLENLKDLHDWFEDENAKESDEGAESAEERE